MSKVRINDLARELEVKSKAILDTLPLVGVTEKKTHSSSLEEHEAEKVRVHLRSSAEGSSPAGKSSSRALRGEEEIKTKIDLSHISRPGDVLKAITQRKEAVAPPQRRVRHSLPSPRSVEKPAWLPGGVSRRTVAPPATRPVATAPAVSRGCSTGSSGRTGASGRCTSCSIVTGFIVARERAGAPGDTAAGSGSSCGGSTSSFGECSAIGSHCRTSGCSSICASSAADDRSANRTAAGVQGSAANGSAAGAAGSANRRSFASCPGTSRARPANFSAASSDGRRSSRCAASAAASG